MSGPVAVPSGPTPATADTKMNPPAAMAELASDSSAPGILMTRRSCMGALLFRKKL
jgi:hypothetical protein